MSAGTNVHNWHWSEKDMLPWSQQRLQQLLGSQTVLNGEGNMWVTTGPDVEVTGEAILNNRKNKLIPAYELAVKGTWQGKVRYYWQRHVQGSD